MSGNTQKLHHFIDAIQSWKHEYQTNEKGELVLQNQKLLTNVVFTHKSFNAIKKYLQEFEKLPDTIMTPQEVWSRWADPETQMNVYRNYIKDNYIVTTLNGEIIAGYLVDNINRFRNGVMLF